MTKILFVFGTRPEAIKLAPVIKELKKHTTDGVQCTVCITAQHRSMLDDVLRVFEICPDYDLDIMQQDQDLRDVTVKGLEGVEEIIKGESPDWVVVQGDTTTTMATAMAAFYRGVRVAHVEAGLRTYDRRRPFPEEINRRLTTVLADLHFAPTSWAHQNLTQEKIPADAIVVTGNTVVDALLDVASREPDSRAAALQDALPAEKRILLVTAHRRESFGSQFEEICLAVRQIALSYGLDLHTVWPVHPNPHVRAPVERFLGDIPNISLLPPLDYERFVHLMKASYLVLTDSGGIQEEAPSLNKPVLVMRDVTERPEGVSAGVLRLVGTSRQGIVDGVVQLLDDLDEYNRMAKAPNPFGDGKASIRIVATLMQEAHLAHRLEKTMV